MDINDIKDLASKTGIHYKDLIALAPGNDPFYTGTPGDWALGRWFGDWWNAFGYTTGVHIRRMHYQLVSQNPRAVFPDGTEYENTMNCWARLNMAAKVARYLGIVDIAAFVDRRTDDPIDHQEYWHEYKCQVGTTWLNRSLDIPLPELPELPNYAIDRDSPQRYHLEIVCEKSTMNDILEPLARRYNGVFVAGKGELSITFAHEMVNRIKRADRPARIFYISDFDPAGASMPVAMSRKIEYEVHRQDLDIDIRLFPIALTFDQTKKYRRLLPTPLKSTERRKAGFEEKYGEGGIELDALEALYPGELDRIVRHELDRYYDNNLTEKVRQAVQDISNQLIPYRRNVYARYQGDIDRINAEWQAIESDFKERVEAHLKDRLEVWEEVKGALDDACPEIGVDAIPRADRASERNGALYDSSRSYLEQNRVYQDHKANMSNTSSEY